MKRALRAIAGGLAIVLPLIITLWLVVWFAGGAESLLGPTLKTVLGTTESSPGFPEGHEGWFRGKYYIPGMGIVAGVALAAIVGLLARIWLFRVIVEWFEHLIGRVPLLKTLYGGIKDLLGLVGGKKASFSRVVLVRLPGLQHRVIGFITQEDLTTVPGLSAHPDWVAVFLCMSYNMGGYTVLVPRQDVEPIDMKVEDALRFSLTAGVSAHEEAVLAK